MNRGHLFSTTALLALIGLAACSNGSDPTALAPIVSAGLDQSVPERSPVQLQGSATDPDSGITVSWTQISGPPITIENPGSAQTQFMAPTVQTDLDLVLRLSASDGTTTVSDDVIIRVTDTGNGPDGPSPQGIPDDGDDRRNNARGGRNGPRTIDSREVRTYDGSSNNTANPEWGATFIHLQRLAASDYADGVDDLAGPTRPSARIISNQVVDQPEGTSLPNSSGGSDFVWQWGQFIDHDLDLTDGAEESADIDVPAGDTLFDPEGTGSVIIPFSRALFDPNTGFNAGNPREQENEITSWIDGSMVYGSDETRAAALRVGPDSAYLATSEGNLLPFNTDSLTNANGFVADPTTLFLAGDIRANEQVGLAVMHTLFVREHNRIVSRLEQEFPEATADEVFELARRLVIAKIQIITYDEWLPALIGPNAIPAYSGYDDTVNPSIFNAFSAAAFRLGHSMLNEQLLRLDATGATIADGHLDLANAFFTAPSLLTDEQSLDPILRGLATQTHQSLDAKIVNDVRNFLFGAPGDGGLDLASLNIQRGRDHGLPSYNDMRVAMGLDRMTGFADISSDTSVVAALEATYDSVDDIDLWIGGLAEDTVPDSLLGELFQAIIVKQFTDLRDGDRFWYQNDLTDNELDRVRNATLARIIRDNTGIGAELQDDVFSVPN